MQSFYLLTVCLGLCSAFIPDKKLRTAAGSPSSVIHTEMVKEGLLRVTVRRFKDQNLLPKDAVYNAEQKRDMFEEVFGSLDAMDKYDQVEDAMQEQVADIDTNEDTKKNPSWHFDAEFIEQGHKKLQGHFQSIVTGIKNSDYASARTTMGRALHPLQDFYSHTNWVEINKPAFNKAVGIPGKAIGMRVARKDEKTCVDCVREAADKAKTLLFAASALAGGDPSLVYTCEDNMIMMDALTSGYSVNQKDDDGNPVEKPEGVGKCSHGGVLDKSSAKPATGGINKDSNNEAFSPHNYLHDVAAAYAIDATEYWINEIRRAVGDDKKFDAFLGINAQVTGPRPSTTVNDRNPNKTKYRSSAAGSSIALAALLTVVIHFF